MTCSFSARVWAAAAAAAVGASLLAVPGVAAADPLPAGCTQADTTGPVTCVYTSGTNELLLPEGVSSVTVTVVGGRGGSYSGGYLYPGGRGAEVTGTVAVKAGTRTLYAVVGGNGTGTTYGDPAGGIGGANGGGTGGAPTADALGSVFPGAGGGGASDIRTAAGDLGSRVVVAAGGGGASSYSPGGDAGEPGGGLVAYPYLFANAGSGTAGGSRGVVSAVEAAPNGTDGSLGIGGAGAPQGNSNTILGGGGGGGGVYGGGGGSIFGSGAGGSSLAPAGTTLSLSDAAPSVTITYQPPTVTPPVCTGSACLPAGLFGSS